MVVVLESDTSSTSSPSSTSSTQRHILFALIDIKQKRPVLARIIERKIPSTGTPANSATRLPASYSSGPATALYDMASKKKCPKMDETEDRYSGTTEAKAGISPAESTQLVKIQGHVYSCARHGSCAPRSPSTFSNHLNRLAPHRREREGYAAQRACMPAFPRHFRVLKGRFQESVE